MFEELFHRRVPHFLAAYLAASWGVIEAVDWLIERYGLSTHLVDLALVTLLSMLPTVLMLAYFHGQPEGQRWTRVEKIGIPANLLLSAGVLVFMFSGKDLGAERSGPATAAAHTQVTFIGEVGLSALSPSGEVVAYTTTHSGGDHKLLVQDIAGGSPLEIDSWEKFFNLSWTPDGSELLYFATTDSSGQVSGGPFLAPRFGGPARRVFAGTMFAWSPDGSQIASTWVAAKRIYISDKSTGDTTSIALSGSFLWVINLDWSPDGNLIAFVVADSAKPGKRRSFAEYAT